MSPAPLHPDLTPAEEALLLSAVEGDLTPAQSSSLEQLLSRRPILRVELAGMRGDRSRLADLEFDLPCEPDFAQAVLARLEPEPLQLRKMDPPHRHLRVRWTGMGVQRLAAAAAVLIIAGFTAVYVRTQMSARGSPGSTNQGVVEPGPGTGLVIANPAENQVESITPAAPEPARVLAVAEEVWKADRTEEPDLARATGLLAEGRLVVRVLATSNEQARNGLDAMQTGIETQSTAWAMAGRLSDDAAVRWDTPSSQPTVMAYDGQSETMIEVPRPNLLEVWSAQLEVDPTAIASLVHALARVGWTVHLEESSEPIAMEPDSLESAIWWNQSPSTWKARGSVPIVIDAIQR